MINEKDKDLAKLRDELVESYRSERKDKAVKAAIQKRIDARSGAAPLHKVAGEAGKEFDKKKKKKKNVGDKINESREGLGAVMTELRRQNGG